MSSGFGCRHELARVIPSSCKSQEDSFDWTLTSRTRVVGCQASKNCKFSEFRTFCPDFKKSQYNSKFGIYEPNCGFENVTFMWTGPEYLYQMLTSNSFVAPPEALSVLRLFLLDDWHSRNEYNYLANDDDIEIRALVAEFDALRKSIRHKCTQELSDEECSSLWRRFYLPIIEKYEISGDLIW